MAVLGGPSASFVARAQRVCRMETCRGSRNGNRAWVALAEMVYDQGALCRTFGMYEREALTAMRRGHAVALPEVPQVMSVDRGV
jgi:hypothetical protein